MAKKEYIIDSGVKLDELCTEMVNDLVKHNWLKVTVEVENRSLSQNALYWMWIRKIAGFMNGRKVTYLDEGTGEIVTEIIDESEEIYHLRMKHDHLGWTPERRVGSVVIPAQIKSTRNLSKGEFMEYLDKLDAYWANAGLLLPKPDDSEYVELKNKTMQ